MTAARGPDRRADAGPHRRGDRTAGRGVAGRRGRPGGPRAAGLRQRQLEGFLFPATYDVEPDTTPADVLRQMVARGRRSSTSCDPRGRPAHGRDQGQHGAGRGRSVEDMGKVARVLENRLADGMPLQLDTTVNYANGKGGITTTPRTGRTPRRTTPTCTRACRRAPSTTRARTRCARCSTRPRVTGASSWSSTRTPATPGSPRPGGARAERAAVPAVAAGAPRG